MAFQLSVKELSVETKKKILELTKVNPKENAYSVQNLDKFCFQLDNSTGTIRLPLGLWKQFHHTNPNSNKVYPKTQFEFRKTLYTLATDPKGYRDQDVITTQALQSLQETGSAFLSVSCGGGKCLHPDTPILMADGQRKKAKSIQINDLLMGDDSTPRRVTSTCRGVDSMYRIRLSSGESFVCNSVHVLTLKAVGHGTVTHDSDGIAVHYFDGKSFIKRYGFSNETDAQAFALQKGSSVIDMALNDFLELSPVTRSSFRAIKTSVDYPHQSVPIDPYLLGIWLASGRSNGSLIFRGNKAAFDECQSVGRQYGWSLVPLSGTLFKFITRDLETISFAQRLSTLIPLSDRPTIPHLYRINDYRTRLRLLNGLVDGVATPSGEDFVIAKSHLSPQLMAEVRDLIESLCVPHQETETAIIITGQPSRKSYSTFSIEELEEGKYCGFTIDGNHRFVLGNYIVTHNTLMGVYLSSVLGLKTAVLSHVDLVNNQWCQEYQETTNAKVQFVKDDVLDPTADVYIMGVQKASKMPPQALAGVGFVIYDEAHISTLTACTKTMLNFEPKFILGLSATPERADGLENLLEVFFGPKERFITRMETKDFTVIRLKTNFKPRIEYMHVKGKDTVNWSVVTNSLAELVEKQEMIVELTQKHKEHRIMVLCDRKEQAMAIHGKLVELGEKVELLIGAKKKWDTSARVLVAGTKKAGTGFNDPTLTMLVLAGDSKNVKQFEGRIRTQNNIIYDIVDDYGVLENHWRLRRDWYLKRGASIIYEKYEK